MSLPALKKDSLPKAPPLYKLLGPSFILLGLGLGSGELILWPYLTANYGFGIIWGALLGISLQFFINMEISRYTLATGESVFVGLTRKLGLIAPIWFILSTLIPWMWPGIIASAGTLVASLLGITYRPILPILMLIAIGIIYSVGSVIYKTQEQLQKLVILVGVPFILLLTLYIAKPTDWGFLIQGIAGQGQGYWLIPAGISAATFLAAFAYAGAGGNLNLGQSLYVKEKGYGMGIYSGKLTGILSEKGKAISLSGTTFTQNEKNYRLFHEWWRKINIEHGLIFWGTGAFTILLLALLAFSTVYGFESKQGIQFIIGEVSVIKSTLSPTLGILFLAVVSVMLFFTQFSVLGTTSRIMTENLLILLPPSKTRLAGRFFYGFLWLQILLGIGIFSIGFKEPLSLVVIGAVLNAFSMFIYTGLILWLNKTALYKQIRPGRVRSAIIGGAFLFYGAFSLFTIFSNFK